MHRLQASLRAEPTVMNQIKQNQFISYVTCPNQIFLVFGTIYWWTGPSPVDNTHWSV